MTFSRRTSPTDPNAPSSNRLSQEVERFRSTGRVLIDLTVSNPTTASIDYDGAAIVQSLADTRALRYAPEALGLPSARVAAASTWGIPPERVAITASTSEAYAALFTLLTDPGDVALVPAPSYPLLAHLAAFSGVRLIAYPLVYAGDWHIDLDTLSRLLREHSPYARMIVTVNPNNPTGSFLGREELERMLGWGLPIVSDEVFASYALGPLGAHRVQSALQDSDGLVFALSGLSKYAGLPQMKLGWIGVSGPPTLTAEAFERLEVVLDASLSVGAPVQYALPRLLELATTTRASIQRRLEANMRAARVIVGRCDSLSALWPEGGWTLPIRLPEVRSDEEWCLLFLALDGVLVHPGYFFDFGAGAFVLVSLLAREEDFADGLTRLVDRVFTSR